MIGVSKVAPLRGEFELRIFKRGRLVVCEREPNLIVAGASRVLARLLAGEAGALAVAKIGFGISGTPAESDDNALTGAYVKAIGSHTFPSPGRVRFNWTLGSAEGNGLQIREFGLLTAGDALVARKVRADGAHIEKAVDLALSGAWTVVF